MHRHSFHASRWVTPHLSQRVCSAVAACLFLFVMLAPSASAQQELDSVFGDFGTVEKVDDESESVEREAGEGTIRGHVVHQETGAPVAGVTVIVVWPDDGSGPSGRQEVLTTDFDGMYLLPSVPPGRYELSFVKSGFRTAKMVDFEVQPDQENVANFPLPPVGEAAAGGVMNLDEFVVTADTVGEMMQGIELRLESDQILDVFTGEDFSKYAASDVAEALKRVAGVTVVEGRFAVIRGLEERYSSTTFNGAPVPSPDPLRQSVPLDLFPSDVVTGLTIAKSFEAANPGNSGAGSIDVGTFGYPEEFTAKLSVGAGFNENANDEFFAYDNNSPIGDEVTNNINLIETDVSGSVGGRRDFWGRDFAFKFVAAHEQDYDSAIGILHSREPELPTCETASGFAVRCLASNADAVVKSGGLALGELNLSGGRFQSTVSQDRERLTLFGGFGFDLDREGDHRVDGTVFYTKNDIENVERIDDGVIAGFDYENTPTFNFGSPNLLYNWKATDGTALATFGSPLARLREVEQLADGPLSISPLVIGRSLTADRELGIYQLNGEHDFGALVEDFRFDWVANYATTSQNEKGFEMRYWYEPYSAAEFDEDNLPVPDQFPPQVSDFPVDEFGPGSFRTNNRDILYNFNAIDEEQWFGRGDFSYEVDTTSWLKLEPLAGFWLEHAERDVKFTDYQGADPDPDAPGVERFFVEGPLESQLGPNVYNAFGLGVLETSRSELERNIFAGSFSLKGTLWEDFDLVAGLRIEDIDITSKNRPFTGLCRNPVGQPAVPLDETRSGDCPDGYLPAIFPQRYVYLDRFDNPNNPFFREDEDFAVFGNQDEILGIDLEPNPLGEAGCPLEDGCVDQLSTEDLLGVLSGKIDETKYLPAISAAYRAPWLEGLTLRAAYSQTTARPSFRELSYYATLEPGEPTRLLGNPFLKLSDVDSYDTRVEYVWGGGDLLAFSFFYKTIDKPIEVIQLSDYTVVDFPLFEGPFRVYRNNENEADLLGIELEAQVTLGQIPRALGTQSDWLFFLDYFSIGANFAYIDAEVKRSEFERAFGGEFYREAGETVEKDANGASILGSGRLPKKRRLFNQPEWTANGNISFNQPDWGTRVTLSVFGISDVLQSAGSARVDRSGQPQGLTLDRFIDDFYQLDIVGSQAFGIPHVPGTWTVSASVKNLTDTERGIIYDKKVVDGSINQRRFKVGRDYSFALQYEWSY